MTISRSSCRAATIQDHASTTNADFILYQEVGLNWTKLPQFEQWTERAAKTKGLKHHKHIFKHNIHDTHGKNNGQQYGGTGIVAKSSSSARVTKSGGDPTGLGRWTWMLIQGKGGSKLRLVSMYRPCSKSDQLGSVYRQHERYLRQKQDYRDPRTAALEDLKPFLEEWNTNGEKILIGMDANDDVRDDFFTDFFLQYDMEEKICSQHDGHSPPSTHMSNESNKPIDSFWGSTGLQVSKSGYKAFERSDHRQAWVEVSFMEALGHNPPNINSTHKSKFNANDPRQRDKYNSLVMREYMKQDIPGKAASLRKKVRDREDLEDIVLSHKELCTLNDKIRGDAADKVRKLRMGGVPWSAKYQSYRDDVFLWQLICKWHARKRVSHRIIRQYMKICSRADAYDLKKEEAISERSKAYAAHKQARTKAPEWRNDHIDALAKAIATKEKRSVEAVKKTLLNNERARTEARRLKKVRGTTRSGQPTQVFSTRDGIRTLHDTQLDMEQAIMRENEARFSLSHDTPSMQEPLVSDLGFLGDTDACNDILNGTYVVPDEVDEFSRNLIEALVVPSPIRELPQLETYISKTDHIQAWQKQKENTAAAPEHLAFSHYMAGSYNNTIAEVDACIRSAPYEIGFSPDSWQIITDFIILKKAQVYDVEQMRTITLFHAAFNINNKKLGRDAMARAEATGMLAKEQYGSRSRHRCNYCLLNKRLACDIVRQKRQACWLAFIDASKCYDRINHNICTLVARRIGIPLAPLSSMWTTLQQAAHNVLTAYGVSQEKYGGYMRMLLLALPLMGTGQGSGWGPAAWALISSVLLQLLGDRGFGAFIVAALSLRIITFVGFAIVDDTDLIHTTKSVDDTLDTIQDEFQDMISHWEGHLKATGGAVDSSSDKTFVYGLDFEFTGTTWRYTKPNKHPKRFYLKDPSGAPQQLKRNSADHAEKTLGYMLAMDGNNKSEIQYLRKLTSTFSNKARFGNLERNEFWKGAKTTIFKQLEYAYPPSTITLQEWETILVPLHKFWLQKCGLAASFPHDVLYGPLDFQGLGLKHPFFHQMIMHIIICIEQTNNNTLTGDLIKTSYEELRLELGCPGAITDLNYDRLEHCATDSWLKGIWKFCHLHDITINDVEEDLTLSRENDIFIMQAFAEKIKDPYILRDLNQCRTYLNAVTLADICAADGTSILEGCYTGTQKAVTTHNFAWPRQPTALPASTWNTWKRHLHDLFVLPYNTTRTLKAPLGKWLEHTDTHWEWFFAPSTDRVYKRVRGQDNTWQTYTWANIHNTRSTSAKKYTLTTLVTPPDEPTDKVTVRVMTPTTIKVIQTGSTIRRDTTTENTAPTTLQEAKEALPENKKWAVLELNTHDNASKLAAAIIQGNARGVSDGSSFVFDQSSSAFILCGPNGIDAVTGGNMVPAEKADQNAHRAELAGVAGMITTLEMVCSIHDITSGTIELGLDGENALNKIRDTHHPHPSKPDYDMVVDIRNRSEKLPIKIKWRWVEGHQDTKGKLMDWWGHTNQWADELAEIFMRRHFRQCPPNLQLSDQGWQISVNKRPLTSVNLDDLYKHTYGQQTREYWENKDDISPATSCLIDWEACGKAFKTESTGMQRTTAKLISHHCGVGTTLLKRRYQDHSRCAGCGHHTEDTLHVFYCKAATPQWTKSLEIVHTWMMATNTDPLLVTGILNRLEAWRNKDTRSMATPPVKSDRHSITTAFAEQDEIGWYNMLRGRVSRYFTIAQQEHLTLLRRKTTGKRWTIALIHKMTLVSWDMWQHRNQIKHGDQSLEYKATLQDTDEQIWEQYGRGDDDVLQQDKGLFTEPTTTLNMPIKSKLNWLMTIKLAREAAAATRASARGPLDRFFSPARQLRRTSTRPTPSPESRDTNNPQN